MEIKKIKVDTIGSKKKPSSKWWVATDDEQLAMNLTSVVESIDNRQSARSVKNLRNARLYGNMDLNGLRAYRKAAKTALSNNKPKLNVCKSAVNTLAAKISKNKPRPLFLTEDGNHAEQRRAQLLTQFVTGQFTYNKTYSQAQIAFVDACVFGTGALKVFISENEVRTERILIDEIVVDESDGIYGTPRSMFQRKYVHKELLKELFPAHAEKIDAIIDTLKVNYGGQEGVSEQILVVEGWHLASSKESKDGLHAIVVDGCTLFQEPYEKDFFPFAFFRWEEPTLGFYGNSCIEELEGIQFEINKTLMDISMSQSLLAVPRVFMQLGSNVTKSLNNEIGAIYNYQGSAPIFSTPSAQAPDVYNHLWQLYAKAFEIVGVSQLSANSKKPAGLDSGVALREYSDIETERFVLAGQRYENFVLEIARIMINLTRDMIGEAKSNLVKIQGSKFVKKIEWSEVDLDEDKYVMQVFPTSLLPSTPAGKLQTVNELTQSGYVDKEKAMELLDFPDVEEFTSLATADIRNTKRLISNMIDKGQYEPPDPLMNLQLALKMTQQSYLKAKVDGVEDDRLELLRQFIEDLLGKLVPEPPPAPVAPPVMPVMAGAPALPPSPMDQPIPDSLPPIGI